MSARQRSNCRYCSHSILILNDIRNVAERIANEKAADTPGLVAQGVNDLVPRLDGAGVDRIDVVDPDRIGGTQARGVFAEDADLRHRLRGRTIDGDEIHRHRGFKPQHIVEEACPRPGIAGVAIGYDPRSGHQPPPTKWTISRASPSASATSASVERGTISRLRSTATFFTSSPSEATRSAMLPLRTCRCSPLRTIEITAAPLLCLLPSSPYRGSVICRNRKPAF